MNRCPLRGRGGAYHFVDSLHYCQHLIVADLAIAIDIVQLERPIQFVLHLAATSHAQSTNKLLEVDSATLVRVKHFEDIVGERVRIAKGEELSVDLLEFFFGKGA